MDDSKDIVDGIRSFETAFNWLRQSLVDRDIEIRLALICLVSRQHLFLLGPPGTGKSYLARLVGMVLGQDAPFFELLLTRFTDPSEVFGPVSMKRFVEHEEFVRKTDRYLPTANVAFLDEIWKSSSAILNALLTIVNERVYDNGGQRTEVPLQTLFSAANELPQDESLGALYDRFLVRREVKPVRNPLSLLDRDPATDPPVLEHLDAVQRACRKVKLPDDVKQGMLEIKTELQTNDQIQVGDRRFQLSASLVRATSLLDGRPEAVPSDLQVLCHAWWQTPDQYLTVARVVSNQIHKLEEARRPPPPPPPTPTPRPSQPTQTTYVGPLRPFSIPTQAPVASGKPTSPVGRNQWFAMMNQLSGMGVDQLRGNPTLQQLIHDCIIAPEAQDPNNRALVLQLTKIKQDLINSMSWVGPSW